MSNRNDFEWDDLFWLIVLIFIIAGAGYGIITKDFNFLDSVWEAVF